MTITETKNGDVVVLTFKGKILLGEGDVQLNKKIAELIGRKEVKILLNLEEVPYMDSGGLGEISRSHTTVRREGGVVKLCSVTATVMDLMVTTKLYQYFDIFDNESEAVASFS